MPSENFRYPLVDHEVQRNTFTENFSEPYFGKLKIKTLFLAGPLKNNVN